MKRKKEEVDEFQFTSCATPPHPTSPASNTTMPTRATRRSTSRETTPAKSGGDGGVEEDLKKKKKTATPTRKRKEMSPIPETTTTTTTTPTNNKKKKVVKGRGKVRGGLRSDSPDREEEKEDEEVEDEKKKKKKEEENQPKSSSSLSSKKQAAPASAAAIEKADNKNKDVLIQQRKRKLQEWREAQEKKKKMNEIKAAALQAVVGKKRFERKTVMMDDDGMFDDAEEDEDANAALTKRKPPNFLNDDDDDDDDNNDGNTKKEEKDTEDDPLEAFMNLNDEAMNKEREKAEEKAKKLSEEEDEAFKLKKEREEEEKALEAEFMRAAKRAARNLVGKDGDAMDVNENSTETGNKIIQLQKKKSIIEVKTRAPASEQAIKNAKSKIKVKPEYVVRGFFDEDSEGEGDDEAKKKKKPSTTTDAGDKGGERVTTTTTEGGKEDDDKDELAMYESDSDDEWAAKQKAKLSKADKLGAVIHSDIDYPPFRKNFYIESYEMSKMTKEEVKELRTKLDGISCRGRKVPKPIKSWNQAGLSNKIMELIRRSGFENPMPIQAQAIPIIMSGRDCIAVAKTGSGKTLAYILPMLRHIKDQPEIKNGDGPIAMIVGPTRELVTQIGKECRKFGKTVGVRCVSVYGGSGVQSQITDLKRGCEAVACTPGRMIDILTTGAGKITNLRRITYFVLDEADRMFDMGFEPQITRILANTRPDRQTVMFSATFPRAMENIARAALENPIEIQVGGRSVVNSDITQLVELREEEDRFIRTLELLGEYYEQGKVIIFVASQDKCDTIFRDLLKSGYPCLSLHGGKEQADRECTIVDFKTDVCNVLVATSVAARGLDVKDVKLVINFDCPNHLEDYVHRVGRTGRAGQKGTAVTFISRDEERFAPDLVKAMKEAKQPVPQDVLALAEAFGNKRKNNEAMANGSGFGGSGFKFDQSEADALKKEKRQAAKAAGLIVEDDNDDDDENMDNYDDDDGGGDMKWGAAGLSSVSAIEGANANAAGGPMVPGQAKASTAVALASQFGATPAQVAQAAANAVFKEMSKKGGLNAPTSPEDAEAQRASALVAAAKAAAGKIASSLGKTSSSNYNPPTNDPTILRDQATKAGHVANSAAAFMSSSAAQNAIMLAQNTALAHGASAGAAKAAAFAAALNAQHKMSTGGKTTSTGQNHFESELEINDFPQYARWKVTHKDQLQQINDFTGAVVTVKGTYYPPGRAIPMGERRLYLLIEGPTERCVTAAKNHVKKQIEEVVSKQTLPGGAGAGRYKI